MYMVHRVGVKVIIQNHQHIQQYSNSCSLSPSSMGRSNLTSVALCAVTIVLAVAEIAQLCLCAANSGTPSPCVERERQALLEFKASLDDPTNWLSSWQGARCCQWEGIGCDNITGHVVKLVLSTPYWACLRYISKNGEAYGCGNNLLQNAGQYVEAANLNPSLLQLEYLTHLDLNGNSFDGSPIPTFIGSMRRLRYLSLSRAGFGGSIPSSVGNLTNLRFLDLSWNYDLENSDINWISGLRSLEYLDLSDDAHLVGTHKLFQVLNMLPSLLHVYLDRCGLGELPVPRANLTNARKLRVLSLVGNGLTASQLDALRNMTSLVHLDLSDNKIISVPLWFARFEKLQFLGLSSCRLYGRIPIAIRNMTSIEFLYLPGNHFTSVPSWFAELNSLIYLDLARNKLTSMERSLSLMLRNMCRLKRLYLSSNNLREESIFETNELSTCISYDLEIIDLSYNNFSGRLPSWLEQFENLRHLFLGENLFHGPISFSFQKFPKLKKLDLSSNMLEGTLPSSMGQLVNLTDLDLSNNRFNGTIPKSLGQLTSLHHLQLSNNSFSGIIPESLSNLVNLQSLDLSKNYFKEVIPKSVSQLINLENLDLSNNYFKGVILKSLNQLVNLKSLDLSNNCLTETIPESIGQLVKLQYLYLSNNYFNGTIPQNLSKLVNLNSLLLSRNKLHGSLPVELDQLVSLSILDISSNKLDGNISTGKEWSSIMRLPQLWYLNLSNTQISGSLPKPMGHMILSLIYLILGNNLINGSIPSSLCQTVLLNHLDLSKNRLVGKIPNCWKDKNHWEEINLSSNNLSGVFPSSLGNLSSLLWLHLNENNLQGELPVSMRNMKRLLIFDVGENQLVGRIPSWTADTFPSLRILRLRQNMLTGGIPSQLCQLSSLQILDLSHNNLQGSIPWCIGNLQGMTLNRSSNKLTSEFHFDGSNPGLWSNEHVKEIMKGREFEYIKILRLVVTMDLSENHLVGFIPEQITLLNGLHGLNLSNNHLIGEIPTMIGDMKSLESFDVSNNQLLGRIPNSMSALTSLSHLNLSNNNFSGPIPTDNQFSTYDPSIYAGNPYLCGLPLPNKCPGDDSDRVPSSRGFEDKDDKIDKLEKWGFYFVIAAGFALGFWGVIGVLFFKKSWRHACFRWVEDVADTIYVEIAIKVAKLKKWLARNRELAD